MGRALVALGLAAVLPAPSRGAEASPDLRVLGFYDVDFYATDAEGGDATSGFRQGQLVFHAISALSERATFFGEVSLTPGSHEFRVEVERAIFKYDFSDLVKLSAGRYHTPINWWNAAFHHGLWLQTTIARPEMTKFGGDFIPVHFVGVLGQGGVDAPGFSVDYEAGLGNGRGEVESRGGDAGDVNNHRAWLVHLFARPDALYELRAGGAYYRDQVGFESEPGVREEILSGYVVFAKETPELIFEAAGTDHKEADGGSYESFAYYVQAAYRLPWCHGLLKPYGRFEEMDLAAGDPVFAGIPDLRRYILGVRADVVSFAAIKLEGRRDREGGGDYVNGFHAQLSLVF